MKNCQFIQTISFSFTLAEIWVRWTRTYLRLQKKHLSKWRGVLPKFTIYWCWSYADDAMCMMQLNLIAEMKKTSQLLSLGNLVLVRLCLQNTQCVTLPVLVDPATNQQSNKRFLLLIPSWRFVSNSATLRSYSYNSKMKSL